MKRYLALFVLMAGLAILNTDAAEAQVKAGVGMAFGSDIEQIGIQGDIHYRMLNRPALQFGGGLIYYFPKDNHNFMELNANAGYIFYEEFMFKSYAYTGLNYARSKVDTGNDSLTDSAIGLNLGLGAEYDFGGILAFGDLKYVISEFDQPVFSIGLRLPF